MGPSLLFGKGITSFPRFVALLAALGGFALGASEPGDPRFPEFDRQVGAPAVPALEAERLALQQVPPMLREHVWVYRLDHSSWGRPPSPFPDDPFFEPGEQPRVQPEGQPGVQPEGQPGVPQEGQPEGRAEADPDPQAPVWPDPRDAEVVDQSAAGVLQLLELLLRDFGEDNPGAPVARPRPNPRINTPQCPT